MTHWKTTLMGVLTIIAGVGAMAHIGLDWLTTGSLPSFETAGTAIASITGGWGLVHAADAKVVNANIDAAQTPASVPAPK